MGPYYRIRNWVKLYEDCATRKRSGPPRRVMISTALSDLQYRHIITGEHGAANLGVQMALIRLGAHMPTRGTFVDMEENPLNLKGFSVMTGLPEATLKRGIAVLSQPHIGFLELVAAEKAAAQLSLLEVDLDIHGKADDEAEVLAEQASTIYGSYPRKAARSAAIAAIKRRLKAGVAYEYLLERTKRYSKARQGEPQQFTPHASTWYNQERYEEPDEQWNSNGTRADRTGPGHGGGTSGEYDIH